MVNPAGNSLLAAQIYGSAAKQLTARPDPSLRDTQFEDAAREAQSTRLRVPVDRVDVAADTGAMSGADKSPTQEEGAGRFAREAPGTSERRNTPPGFHLDIRI